MKEQIRVKRFSSDSRFLLSHINTIVNEYLDQ